MSSSMNPHRNPLSADAVTEKLTRSNHAIWQAQVLSAVRGARLYGHLTGDSPSPAKEIQDKDDKKVSNPAFEEWEARDQQILSFILTSVSSGILSYIAKMKTAAEAWDKLEAMFASQTRARAVNLRIALANTKKGNSSAIDYFTKMKGFSDEMAAAGRSIGDDELVEYILTGLPVEYESLVTSLVTRVESVTVDELYSQLLNYETRMDLVQGADQSSANMAGRGGGRGNNRGRGGSYRGRGRGPLNGGSRGRGHRNNQQGGGSNNKKQDKPICQVCFKEGHTAARCWHRFDEDFVPEERHAAAATNSYNIDTNWYTDSGSTDHITSELEKLSMREKYNNGDQIHTASGAGMAIKHVGQSTIVTPSRNLQLKNVLHVPKASKNLVSVHRFTSDNSAYMEFHPTYFLVKDQATKKTLLKGRCHRGLYPLPSPPKQVLAASRPSLSRWHERLGHPASPVIRRIISNNSLSFASESNNEHVCDACQQAKAHQLPYPKSVSQSSAPLELVFSDVWGQAIESVGRKQYYVSFYR